MTLVLKCPLCGEQLAVTEALMGQQARCTACGDILTVPIIDVTLDPLVQRVQPPLPNDPQAPTATPLAYHPVLPCASRQNCANCGAVLTPNAAFCAACGARADTAPPETDEPILMRPSRATIAQPQVAVPQANTPHEEAPREEPVGGGGGRGILIIIGAVLLVGLVALVLVLTHLSRPPVWEGEWQAVMSPGLYFVISKDAENVYTFHFPKMLGKTVAATDFQEGKFNSRSFPNYMLASYDSEHKELVVFDAANPALSHRYRKLDEQQTTRALCLLNAADVSEGDLVGQAFHTTCMSHQKQLAMAIAMYAMDHNGKLPGTLTDLDLSAVATGDTLACPAYKYSQAEVEPVGFGYGYNGHLVGLMMNQIITPLTTPSIADSDNPQGLLMAETDIAVDRHQPGYVLGYLDGHVEWVKTPQPLELKPGINTTITPSVPIPMISGTPSSPATTPVTPSPAAPIPPR